MTGQLIYYECPDAVEASVSRYAISETDKPGDLLAVLSAALGTTGEVWKSRLLFTIDQTRVHLDCVEGSGYFVEIEVVLDPSQTDEHGQEVAVGILHRLGITDDELVTCAHIDLL